MFELVLCWVRLHNEWHAENEDGVTLCAIPTLARVIRVPYKPARERCEGCDAVIRRLREMGSEE